MVSSSGIGERGNSLLLKVAQTNKQTSHSPFFLVLLRRYLHEPHRTLASLLASITNAHASGKKKKKRCMFVGVWVIILPQGSCSYWPEWSEGISWRLGPAGWEGTSHLALTPQCGPELLYNMAHVHMTKHLSTLLPLFHFTGDPHPTPPHPQKTHTHTHSSQTVAPQFWSSNTVTLRALPNWLCLPIVNIKIYNCPDRQRSEQIWEVKKHS